MIDSPPRQGYPAVVKVEDVWRRTLPMAIAVAATACAAASAAEAPTVDIEAAGANKITIWRLPLPSP
jgi:hypothetical protein